MADREKVIRGLEWCIKLDGNGCSLECPYLVGKSPCPNAMLRDALALLREQEPRLMKLEEVRKYAINKDPVFVEWSVGEPSWIAMTVEMVADLMKSGNTNLRVWTSRPTPEQMRETPWEGEGIK